METAATGEERGLQGNADVVGDLGVEDGVGVGGISLFFFCLGWIDE